MRQNNFFFVLFLIFLSVFIWFMMDYWTAFMSIGSQSARYSDLSGRSLRLTAYILVGYCLFVLLLSLSTFKIKGIFLTCLIWIGFMPVISLVNSTHVSSIGELLLWPVLFMVSFYFVSENDNRIKTLRFLFLIVFLYSAFLFVRRRYISATSQTNVIYFSVFLLPWLLWTDRKKMQIVLLVVMTILALLSMKRSIMIGLALTWMFWVFRTMGSASLFRKLFVLLLAAAVLMVLFQLVNNYTGGYLYERITREETDEGSNRLAIYGVVWEMIRQSDAYSLLIGHGHSAVYRDSILRISAHNDFLECIYDYGLIIFTLYVSLWVFVIRRCVRLYKDNSRLFLPYLASVSLFISQSLFEHLLLYTSWFNYLVIFWGCAEVMIEREKIKYTIT